MASPCTYKNENHLLTIYIHKQVTIYSNMGAHRSKEEVPPSRRTVITRGTASSSTFNSRQRIVQNFLLIWMDVSMDPMNKDCQNTLTQLRSVVQDINVFTQPDECIEFLETVENEKVFIIISGSLGQQLVPDIHNMPHVDAIYIFCGNRSRHDQWTKKWPKIKGVHTEIQAICNALKRAAKQCNEDLIPLSFVKAGEEGSSKNVDQLEPSFMYTQIFKEILFEMEYNERSIKNLATYCRTLHAGNVKELKIINEFEREYRPQTAIWWYTLECFTYQMLNRALRTLEADTIINMGFFIRDLHRQIEQLHQKQVASYRGKPFVVYRGQGLTTTDFEKLVKTKGGLMSFSNFLSTSKNQAVSLEFVEQALAKTDTVGILFKMSIDPSVSSTPFASIEEVSYLHNEAEILFSMHTVFRIGEITKIDNNRSLYQVKLKLTADDDHQLRTLNEYIQKEAGNGSGWQRIGNLLLKIGEFDKADELYSLLFEQTSDEGEKAHYYNQLGFVKEEQGDYDKAIWYQKKALDIYQNILPSNHRNLATSYNNIASVYYKIGEYSKALLFYGKALDTQEKTLPPNHPSLATFYNNIGLVYRNMGEHSKALSFYGKALEIRKKAHQSNHPDLATSYNNIASVYHYSEKYSEALPYYEQALHIFQRSNLPANHPSIITVQKNIECLKKNLFNKF
jgi:tetratricopeptide (TPR) repeat protein